MDKVIILIKNLMNVWIKGMQMWAHELHWTDDKRVERLKLQILIHRMDGKRMKQRIQTKYIILRSVISNVSRKFSIVSIDMVATFREQVFLTSSRFLSVLTNPCRWIVLRMVSVGCCDANGPYAKLAFIAKCAFTDTVVTAHAEVFNIYSVWK